MNHQGPWVFVSPHLDDVVLSCGGILSKLADQGCTTHVVTVFAGSPQGNETTALGDVFGVRWGLGADPMGRRRDEDREALAQLSAAPHQLSHRDCIYRVGPGGPRFPDERSIFAPHNQTELDILTAVANDLATLLEGLQPSIVVGPLGIGRHADHALTHRALTVAEGDADLDRRLAWFEDLPYASNGSHPGWQQELCVGMRPELIELDEPAFAAKLSALSSYRSQLSAFWPDDAAMARELRRYAFSVGPRGGLAERLWTERTFLVPTRRSCG